MCHLLQQLPHRHCPSCRERQRASARPARGRAIAGPYFHVVFTLPPSIARIAYQNTGRVRLRSCWFKGLGRAPLLTIPPIRSIWCPDRITLHTVLHTWGSTMTHPPARSHYRARSGGTPSIGQRLGVVHPKLLAAGWTFAPLYSRTASCKSFSPLTATRPLTPRQARAACRAQSHSPPTGTSLKVRCTSTVQSHHSADPGGASPYLSPRHHRVASSTTRLICQRTGASTLQIQDYRVGRASPVHSIRTRPRTRVHRRFPRCISAQGVPSHRPYASVCHGGSRSDNTCPAARELLAMGGGRWGWLGGWGRGGPARAASRRAALHPSRMNPISRAACSKAVPPLAVSA